MVIDHVEFLFDGGSLLITTDNDVEYVFDYRTRSRTIGRLFEDYPSDGNRNMFYKSFHLELDIIDALKTYLNSNNLDKTLVKSINDFICEKELEFSDRNKTLIRFGSITFEYNEKEELEIISNMDYDGKLLYFSNVLEKDDVISLINYLDKHFKK